jgi:hypothetical protein
VCTLTLAWQVFPGEPVVVAANRDELLDRPSEPPARRTFDDENGTPVAVVAPRDVEAGGTWVGYSERGLFAGLTNRWVDGLDAERSRGLLVRDALARPDAESAARSVERAVEAHEYDGFNLVIADATGAFLLEWDGRLAVTRLDPGVHVVVNVGAALGGGGTTTDRFFVPEIRPAPAERQADSARRVRAALTVEPGESPDNWTERAKDVLGDHDYGVCVHGDDEDPDAPPASFGTKSSSLIRLGDGGTDGDGDRDDGGSGRDPPPATYEFADGSPCRVQYVRVSESV